MSKTDYIVYMRFLREYLLPKKTTIEELLGKKSLSDVVMERIYYLQNLKNYSERVRLVSFCLMPNHIHLQLYQKDTNAISEFLHSLHTRYARYFNKTHFRVGTLFQERYKYVYTGSDRQILALSRYIHLNPTKLTAQYEDYPWSSFKFYKRGSKVRWVSTELLRDIFKESGLSRKYKSYTDFVEAGLKSNLAFTK